MDSAQNPEPFAPDLGWLALLQKGRVERKFPLPAGGATVGRDDECEICVSDEHVSRRHCRIALVEGRATVGDLRSLSGTRVNGSRMETQALNSGDLVHIGRTLFIYLVSDRPAPLAQEGAPTGWLTVREPGASPKRLPVTRTPILVGSAPQSHIRLPQTQPDFVAQIVCVINGGRLTDLRYDEPAMHMLIRGVAVSFGPIHLDYDLAAPEAVSYFGGDWNAGSFDAELRQAAKRRYAGTRPNETNMERLLREESERAGAEPVRVGKHELIPPPSLPVAPVVAAHCLTGRSGEHKDRTIQIGEELIIGAAEDCGLRLASPGIAPQHARLFHQEGDLVVEDLNGEAGTFINDRRIRRQPLKPGDVLRFGDEEFLVHL